MGNSYNMRTVLCFGQTKQVGFKDQEDGIHDQPISWHYQLKIYPLSKS